MKKIFIIFIILFSSFSIVKADFFENLLNLDTWLQEIKFSFVELKNPHLKNKKYQRIFQKLNYINPKIQKAILRQYKSGRFWYYQTLWLIEHYNNFLYYSNKYFETLKDKEIYWNTKEIKQNLYNNFQNMKEYYNKFSSLAKQKNMN